MPYPVAVELEQALTNRNRLTTAFRLILAITHLILEGWIGVAVAGGRYGRTTVGSEVGQLGAVAIFLAMISWVTIVFAGTHIPGIRQFTTFYLRWRVRAIAYLMLLEDAYPPFGEGPYPAAVEIVDPPSARDRLSVGLRLLFALLTSSCCSRAHRVGVHDDRGVVQHSVDGHLPSRTLRVWRRGASMAAARRGVPSADGGRVSAVFSE